MRQNALSQSEPDEAQLIERARQNDDTAIRLIIKQQNRRLYRIARSIVRDDSEAEDALQEAYVHAFAISTPSAARPDWALGLPASSSMRRLPVCGAAGPPWISIFLPKGPL